MSKPSLSPYMAPALVCSGMKCTEILEGPTVHINAKTGVRTLVYICRKCEAEFSMSATHASGDWSEIAQSGKKPPEVLA